jgi:hypothetical protein
MSSSPSALLSLFCSLRLRRSHTEASIDDVNTGEADDRERSCAEDRTRSGWAKRDRTRHFNVLKRGQPAACVHAGVRVGHSPVRSIGEAHVTYLDSAGDDTHLSCRTRLNAGHAELAMPSRARRRLSVVRAHGADEAAYAPVFDHATRLYARLAKPSWCTSPWRATTPTGRAVLA